MKVFISWSGELSRGVAQVITKNMKLILQEADFFFSKHDIESGARWGREISDALEECQFGIFCLTPDNQHKPWVLFEAGALTKTTDAKGCALLLQGLKPTDVTGPLAQFQHRTMDREGFETLVLDINKSLKKPQDVDGIRMLLDALYPKIESAYKDLSEVISNKPIEVKRSPDEMLEEILESVRRIERFRARARENRDESLKLKDFFGNAEKFMCSEGEPRHGAKSQALRELQSLWEMDQGDAILRIAKMPHSFRFFVRNTLKDLMRSDFDCSYVPDLKNFIQRGKWLQEILDMKRADLLSIVSREPSTESES